MGMGLVTKSQVPTSDAWPADSCSSPEVDGYGVALLVECINHKAIQINTSCRDARILIDKDDGTARDALKAEFPQFDIVVANILYGTSSPLIAKLVFGNYSFLSAAPVIAERICAEVVKVTLNSIEDDNDERIEEVDEKKERESDGEEYG
ncbi:hypothetical protein C5167_010179 [Papaver somniferum]|uniref:Uncharacterized protein n=1 Tax=Papaver somniferum TaxID=3469 RepID=A0A4Y7K0L9_PAPSO|nr:hypothetical protein C5167_010179 [Papaver somniferum]